MTMSMPMDVLSRKLASVAPENMRLRKSRRSKKGCRTRPSITTVRTRPTIATAARASVIGDAQPILAPKVVTTISESIDAAKVAMPGTSRWKGVLEATLDSPWPRSSRAAATATTIETA
nr:hypothetical protein [Arsenicicoccus bolidensis]